MSQVVGENSRGSYDEAIKRFDIDAIAAQFAGDLENGINACVECCDRYAGGEAKALDWLSADGRHEVYTFARLKEKSAQFANFLTGIGVRPGEVVSGLLPRTPDLVAVILGTLRAGAVYQPLFTAFGPKAIEHRVAMSRSRLIVTDTANRPKLDTIADCPPAAVISGDGDSLAPGDTDFVTAMAAQPADFAPVMRKGSDLMLMMSTSGTTGPPKGVPVPISALASFRIYMSEAIDLQEADRFWNIADPGWAYGLYYAVLGPLLLGHATTLCEEGFTVEGCYRTVEQLGITNFAGAPTAYRMLLSAGAEAAADIKGQLRVVSSAGEPLNPEVIRWFRVNLDAPIHDHYGQTETGMVVNNHHRLAHPVREGSAGYAMPGFKVAVLVDNGEIAAANEPGTLAVDIAGSPAFWFTGYWETETEAIGGGYYRTGDTVEQDENGCVTFVGRSDDVITSSGYRIGPFDVESALLEHDSVAEAAVVGVPDPERTEIVKAVVVLREGFGQSDELKEELRLHVRNRLSGHAYPRIVEFTDALPKTPSGKIQRFLLRKQAAG